MTAALMAASTAVGAPDKTVVLSAATPEFAWDGVQGQYTNVSYDEETCSSEHADSYCELILLDLRSDTPVTLDASLTEFSNPIADFDLRIYKSNAAGTFTAEDEVETHTWDATDPGTPGWGGPNGIEEFFHAEGLPGGFYMLTVSHFFNPNATYKGHVKVTGATGGGGGGATPPPSGGGGGGGETPPSGGGGGSTPPPANQPPAQAGPLPIKFPGSLGSAKKAKKKKSLTFKATATEAISNLSISLVDKKKKVVGKTTVASFPKGSKKLKLKVKKLKAGKYTLITSGTVNGQNRVNSQAVKVKK